MTSVAVVGAGPNGLSAACRLAQAGIEVTVYERAPVAGGACRSEALFGVGSVVDMGAAAHPFGTSSPAFQKLKLELYGLEWMHPKYPMAHPLIGKPAAILHRDPHVTAESLGKDSVWWKHLHAPLIQRPDAVGRNFMGPLLKWPQDPIVMARFGARAIWSAKSIARFAFRTEEAQALFIGSALHSTLPPSHPMTAAFGLVFGALGMTTGWPVARGGSQAIADALVKVLQQHGGKIEYDTEISDLRDLDSYDALVLDLVPSQILQMGGTNLSASYERQLRKWRYGTGVYKVDYLLDGPVPWRDVRVAEAGTVHVGGNLDELQTAESAVARGKTPMKPFVMLSQQQHADPSRSTRLDRHVVWTYAHVPNGCPHNMRTLIEAQVERFAPGFRERIIAAVEHSPADLERWNPNLVGGDIGGGALDGMQQVFRPVVGTHPYRAGRRGLYVCSSSTPPGGGVHGMGGWHAAEAVLKDLT